MQERAPTNPTIESRYFPYLNYVFFEACNTDPIMKKISEFN